MRVIGIAKKPIKRGPMKEVAATLVTTEAGLAGDCRGTSSRSKKRQVTVLSIQQWHAACQQIGTTLPWHARRANVCIWGMTFGPHLVGKYLSIGREVLLEITGETAPCARMDEIHPGLKDALAPDWRGGITCRVIDGGIIAVNNEVRLYATLR